jgi:DNA-binding NarL/FixJ family response regulator
MRYGLRHILTDEFKRVEIDEAATANEAINLVREKKWDLVMLDMTMPGQSGLEALKEIKSISPKLPVLILSGHPEGELAERFLQSGASGYITKAGPPAELLVAVRKVMAGGRYVSAALSESIVGHLGIDTEKPPHERLSNREFQIMRLIASGIAVGKIAIELKLSPKTISTHRTRILLKMGLSNSAELMHYAIKNKVVDPM